MDTATSVVEVVQPSEDEEDEDEEAPESGDKAEEEDDATAGDPTGFSSVMEALAKLMDAMRITLELIATQPQTQVAEGLQTQPRTVRAVASHIANRAPL